MMMPNTLLPFRRIAAIAATLLLAAAPSLRAQNISAPLTVTTLAGTAGTRQDTDGTGATARFFGPAGLVFDASGNLIVADSCNNLIRKVTTGGIVTTFIGTPINPPTVSSNIGHSDGTGAGASFQMGSWQSSTGAPFDTPTFANPGSVTVGKDSAGNLYIADTSNLLIRKITPAGVVTTIAGQWGVYGSNDGPGGSAAFVAPGGTAVDSSGNIFVTDSGNDTIRKITPSGDVTTFAGTAKAPGSADGTGAAARFLGPQGIAVDSANNLYVTDTGNHTIRKITPSGVVTTIAGAAGQSGSADGSGTQARFNGPLGIAVDASGNVFVADTKNHTIRRISSAGTVTTIAGSAGLAGSTDGTGTNALFSRPTGIAVDGAGVAYISDFDNNTIRVGAASSSSGVLTVTSVPPSVVQVTATSNVTLKVVATGTPAPTYQWKKNGTAIVGATTSSLALTSVSTADTANYSVYVASNLVTFTSAPTQLTVYAQGTAVPVAIISQPSDRTVAAGQSTTFAVEASSPTGATLSYQWKKGGTAITGATASSYTISSVQTGDEGTYTVTVSDGVNGSSTTSGATLAVSGGTSAVAPIITVQPIPQAVVLNGTATFTAAASGTPTPTYQWQKDGANVSNSSTISGATTGTLTITNVGNTNLGTYTLVATNAGGTAVSTGAALTLTSAVAPAISVQPQSTTITAGGNVTFSVTASGTPTPTYQWQKNSVAISGATSSTYTINSVSSTDAADYTVLVSNSAGNVTSSKATLTVNAATGPAAWLTNVSVRTTMVAGQNPLTVGLTVRGGAKDILVRGAGPALGVLLNMSSGFMADPKLDLYVLGASTPLLSNDNWDSSLSTTFSQLGAFPFPAGSKDAAFIQKLDGNYTVQIPANGAGLFVIEAYDVNWTANSPRLINISALNRVGTGDDVLIAGFHISGTGKKKLLVRAVGPTLGAAPFNVPGVLADPMLQVYDAASNVIATNNDWDASLTTDFDAVGAFHLLAGSKDAATIVTLDAGASYTVLAKGADGGTGQAIIEVYEIP